MGDLIRLVLRLIISPQSFKCVLVYSYMSKSLVIVESPAKAKTIQKYLGKDFKIEASKGHVRDLPEKRLGVKIESGFLPEYEVLAGREKIVEKLRKAAEQAERIFLAPDPDREGEAIAWHIAELIGAGEKCRRATFNEVTRRAIQNAIENSGAINQNLVDAQQARRILDRLVGYMISPLLGRKLRWGLSAGRVQSVAVRLVVEREREIRAFKPEEYWSIEARAHASVPPPFTLKLSAIEGKKAEVANQDQAHAIVQKIQNQPFVVASIDKKEVRRKAPPPFITSTLQQEAARKLRFTTSRTMQVAQGLYEGIELGQEGAVGLITYMRTDSVRIGPEALDAARSFIQTQYGRDYVPETPNFFRSGKAAQDAHEAIRPTDLAWTPERAAPYLKEEELGLYRLIWNRFLACQMTPAVFEQTRVEATPPDDRFVFSATGQVVKFPGFLTLYVESKDEDDESRNGLNGGNGANGAAKPGETPDTEEMRLPLMKVGETLKIEKIEPLQHFTKPVPRFSEATLVRELERLGIGRPSTYAAIVSTIQTKKYVLKDKGHFRPTEMGELVTDLLVKSFPEILDANFTAKMETELDLIEQGQRDWTLVLKEFYAGFAIRLKEAEKEFGKAKSEVIETEYTCPTCGKPMVLRVGRNGRFLACKNYPECKTTRDIQMTESGEIRPAEPLAITQNLPDCDLCGKPMVLKRSKKGPFLACSSYPDCKNTLDCKVAPDGTVQAAKKLRMADEVNCPVCGKPMKLRTGKRGPFLSCSAYPDCKETLDVAMGPDGRMRPLPKEVAAEKDNDVDQGGGEAGAESASASLPKAAKTAQAARASSGSTAIPAPPDIVCEICGRPMLIRRGRFGPFFTCTGYPECKGIRRIPKDMKVDLPPLPPKPKPVPTDVMCPECGKPMVIRMSKRGPFLGCSAFPKCRSAQPLPDHLK